MKHWTTYPLVAHPYNPEFVSGEGLARFARTAEAAGFVTGQTILVDGGFTKKPY